MKKINCNDSHKQQLVYMRSIKWNVCLRQLRQIRPNYWTNKIVIILSVFPRLAFFYHNLNFKFVIEKFKEIITIYTFFFVIHSFTELKREFGNPNIFHQFDVRIDQMLMITANILECKLLIIRHNRPSVT